MSLSRDSLAERQLKIIRRAQFGLKQRLERALWEYNELYPELEKMKAGQPILGLDVAKAFEVVLEDHPTNETDTNDPTA